jgi:hypothetical protein
MGILTAGIESYLAIRSSPTIRSEYSTHSANSGDNLEVYLLGLGEIIDTGQASMGPCNWV